jgi:hypothetical protein
MSNPLIQSRPSLPAAVALLSSAGLPTSDLTEAHLEHLFYYASAERANAPAEIRGTREFADICPTSSAFMVKRLVP